MVHFILFNFFVFKSFFFLQVDLGWIGLFRSKVPGKGFVWNDGTMFNASQFDPKPSFLDTARSSSPSRNCVAFWKDSSWRTFPCNQTAWRGQKMKAICQYEKVTCQSLISCSFYDFTLFNFFYLKSTFYAIRKKHNKRLAWI